MKPGGLSREDHRAVEILEETTKLTDDGHYQTGLLWKQSDIELPNKREQHMEQAENRLMNLKFKRHTNYEEIYGTTMNEYIKKNTHESYHMKRRKNLDHVLGTCHILE